MKVVLQQRVAKLGNAGDVVIAKNGYARNFLIPQGMAKYADKAALNEAETLKKKGASDEAARVAAIEKQLKAIDGKTFVIASKTDENGKLFGSVSAKDVLERLNEGGEAFAEADLSWEAKKEVGTFEATIAPDAEHKATVTITVESE